MLDKDNKLSEVIAAIRFPLIVLVVFIHSIPVATKEFEPWIQGLNLYHVLCINLSRNIAFIAVPSFFFISGFLFFYKHKSWSFQGYVSKLKKRIRTLVIPYLVWNLLFVLVVLTKNYIVMSRGGMGDGYFDQLHRYSLIELFWTNDMPINYPLWYLRDLIVLALVSPIIFFFLRYTKFYGVLILILINFSGFDFGVSGLSINALTFFSIGAFFSIHNLNFLLYFKKWRYVCLGLAIITAGLAYLYLDKKEFFLLNRFYTLFGVISVFNIVERLIINSRIKMYLIYASHTVFFIFCIHGIYIIETIRGILASSFLSTTELGMILCYFLLTTLVLLISMFLYFFAKRVLNVPMGMLLGEHTKNKTIA